MRATTAALSIDGQTGTDAVDTVNVGSLAPSLGGSLVNIAGPVSHAP